MLADEDFFRDDLVRIIWKIQNFSLNTCTQGKSIVSPEFEVKKLGNSCWQMELYPNGNSSKDYIACHLIPKMENTTYERNKYSLTMSLTVEENELAKIEETWIAEKSEVWKCQQLLKRDLLPNPLPDDALSICCIIKPETYNDPRSDHNQMICLSENLIGLQRSGEHHDLVLVTDDGECLKVHKCVMSVRWPNLLGSSSTNLPALTNYKDCGSELKVHGINSRVMKAMIRYAYSGKLEIFSHREVFRSAVHANFNTLIKTLTTFPKHYYAVTNFNIEHKIVVWHLDDISSWDTAPPSFIRILPITQLFNRQEITLVFSIKTDEDGDEAIDIAFRFSNICKPTILKCKMSLSLTKDITSPFKSGEHLFENKDFWHFPQLFKKRDIPDKKRSLLTMDLTLSDGFTTGIIKESQAFISTECAESICDLRKLCSDMATIMIVEPGLADNVWRYTNGICVNTHRAILWARWPQLGRIIGVEVNELIQIFSSSELVNVFLYVYTGNSGLITTTTAQKLMVINRTYPMPSPMFEMCRSILDEPRI